MITIMLKETIKQFFGTSWAGVISRVLLTPIAFGVITLIYELRWKAVDYKATGWPFHFSASWRGPCERSICYRNSVWLLAVDVIVAYLIVCSMLFLLVKIKSRRILTT